MQGAGPLSLAARRAFGRRACQWPALSVLRLGEIEAPRPPGAGWSRVRPRLAGICGSDLASLTGKSPTVLWPLVGFPSVPGHEVVADVVEPAEGSAFSAGDRVAVDPFLSCAARGIDACPACERGEAALCVRAAEPAPGLERGMMIGYHRDLPGGWAETMWAHESQMHAVPDGLDDRTAVMTEPLSVASHALMQVDFADVRSVLVVGGGTIGLSCVVALSLLGAPRPIVAVRHGRQAEAVRALGGEVLPHGDWARAGGARTVRGWAGRPLQLGGFDLVVDAVGSESVLARAAAAVRAGGTVVRVGDVGTLPAARRPDIWVPDVRLLQPFGYGREKRTGGHTFDFVLGAVASMDSAPLASLVTHTFPLDRYRDALAAALDHGRSGSIKVAFRPGA